jgi:hypothetical protein
MSEGTKISTPLPPRAKFGHACTIVSRQVENVLSAAILADNLLEEWTDLPDGVRYLVKRIIDHANDTEAAFDNLKGVIDRHFGNAVTTYGMTRTKPA